MSADAATAEALLLVERLSALLDALAVRGLRAAGSEERARLSSLRDALAQIGAEHLRDGLAQLLDDLDAGRREAARTLLRTRASVRVFERLLSLHMVRAELAAAVGAAEGA